MHEVLVENGVLSACWASCGYSAAEVSRLFGKKQQVTQFQYVLTHIISRRHSGSQIASRCRPCNMEYLHYPGKPCFLAIFTSMNPTTSYWYKSRSCLCSATPLLNSHAPYASGRSFQMVNYIIRHIQSHWNRKNEARTSSFMSTKPVCKA